MPALGAQRLSELSQAVKTTMPATMMVAVIMVFPWLSLGFVGAGGCRSFVEAGEGSGEPVEQSVVPEGIDVRLREAHRRPGAEGQVHVVAGDMGLIRAAGGTGCGPVLGAGREGVGMS